jgi:hypothetical protein
MDAGLRQGLSGLVQSLQLKVGELAKGALSTVASVGSAILQFIAAIMTAHGDATRAIVPAVRSSSAWPVRSPAPILPPGNR